MPKYKIVHQHHSNYEDFLEKRVDVTKKLPSAILLEVQLPRLESMQEAALDINERMFIL